MIPEKAAVVLTSISAPNAVMQQISADCAKHGMRFIVIGDTKSPADFLLAGCDYYSIEAQLAQPFRFAHACPTRHYARKNIGYLLAMQAGCDVVIETDDDNMPGPDFYRPLPVDAELPAPDGRGWINLYRYFTDRPIWPRGLPLDAIRDPAPLLAPPAPRRVPIQQGLADENPDVDAIYRLALDLPFNFERRGLQLAIGEGQWCPYNSQNTVHYREAFPLLYLPAHCSFRMTDIWRSFVAQRIAWSCDWSILFREATVVQDRNDHDLMRDFADEIPGYISNRKICSALASLELAPGVEAIHENLVKCYTCLVAGGYVGAEELPLLDAWLADIEALS
jgi:hypothetical protein